MEFLKSKLTYFLGLVLAFAAGYVVCIWTPRPVTVIERNTEKHLQVIDQSKKVDLTELMNRLATEVQKRNVSTTRTEKRPDGTVIEEKTIDLSETNSKIETNTAMVAKIDERLHLLDEKLKIEEKIVIKEGAKSNHRVGALLGYDFGQLFGYHEEHNLIPVHGLVGQLQYQQRLVGNVWWIVWAQSTGAGGGGLQLEW